MNPFEQEIKNCFSATKVNIHYTKLETRHQLKEAEVTQDNILLQKKGLTKSISSSFFN